MNRPVAVSLPTRHCTLDKVTALKQVLARHPGTAQVHLRLVSGDRVTTLELDQSLRVTPSSALMGDLKALLGPGCLSGWTSPKHVDGAREHQRDRRHSRPAPATSSSPWPGASTALCPWGRTPSRWSR